MGLDLDDFGELDLEDGAPAATGDDMPAPKTLTLSLAQINAAATPSGGGSAAGVAAITFTITDVIDVGGKATFKTNISAASQSAAFDALNVLVGAPLFTSGNEGIGLGTTITVVGTSGYAGVHELEAGVNASGGFLTLGTATAIGATEAGVTATATFTKMAVAAWPGTALPSNSIIVATGVTLLGTAAGGPTVVGCRVRTMRAGGTITQLAGITDISVVDRATSQTGNVTRSAISAGEAPHDLTSWWLVVGCGGQAGTQLDDITGLDAGIIAYNAYVEVSGLA